VCVVANYSRRRGVGGAFRTDGQADVILYVTVCVVVFVCLSSFCLFVCPLCSSECGTACDCVTVCLS